MITDQQKKIYNLYLSTTRRQQNKPFSFRKNFDKFEESPNCFLIQKLSQTFQQYPHLLRKEFFEAPYKIYSDANRFFDLKFYASSKGLSTCIAYLNVLDKKNPDKQLEYIKESLKFIYDFCVEKKIGLRDYVFFKTVAQNDCLKHIKEHRVSWYVIFDIPNFLNIVTTLSQDEFILYFGTENNYGEYLVRLNKYPNIRESIRKGVRIIEKRLDSAILRA